MTGKGDNRRPAAVKREEFERRWEATFGPSDVVCPDCAGLAVTGIGAESGPMCFDCHDCGCRWWDDGEVLPAHQYVP